MKVSANSPVVEKKLKQNLNRRRKSILADKIVL